MPPQEGFIYTEVVAAFDHPVTTRPPWCWITSPGVDFPIELESENVGVLNIRSVYDINGVVADPVVGGIDAVRNPSNPAYATRPARFMRIEKAVSLPDEDIRDVPNTAFGPQGRGLGMRDILGYAPVEPDGSVKVKVPANVPFMISVLDRNGRRIGPQHNNWLQVVPGEELQCNGCHNPNSTPERAHGRKACRDAINAGAPSSGLFPNTNAALDGQPQQDHGGNALDGDVRSRAACRARRELRAQRQPHVRRLLARLPAPTRFDACYGEGATNFGSNPGDLTQKHVCATDAGVQHAAADLPGLRRRLVAAAAESRSTTSSIFIRCGGWTGTCSIRTIRTISPATTHVHELPRTGQSEQHRARRPSRPVSSI